MQLTCSFAAASAALPACSVARAADRDRGPVRVIVHADDAGMCHSVNAATMAALESGAVSSAGIMVPCPWFPEMAAWRREHPEADVGLHLTLTSEWRGYRWGAVAPRDRVPGLVDPDGCLYASVAEVVGRARPEEVEIELRAQIEKALKAGIRPTHLDTHMGTVYARDDFFRVYLALGREYGIPCMVVRPGPETEQLMKSHGVHVQRESIALAAQYGMPQLDMLITGVQPAATFEDRKRAWLDVLSGLKPGVTQIIVHLAGDDPEIRAITGAWRARWNDYRVFSDSEVRRFIAEHGIELIGWKDLAKEAAWPPK